MTDTTKAPTTERLREMLEAAEAAGDMHPGRWHRVEYETETDGGTFYDLCISSANGRFTEDVEDNEAAVHITNMDPPTSIAILRELIEARERIARLEGHVAPDCACPCCESERECSPDCTYSDDHPDLCEAMLAARVAMYGKEANDDEEQE